jgi:hypothetical protein
MDEKPDGKRWPWCIWLVILATCLIGCGPSPEPTARTRRSPDHAEMTRQAASAVGVLDEARVLAIARKAVATNDTWLDRAEFDTPIKQPDGSWGIVVWRLPKTPGGHRLITIDDKGKVKDYMRGK